MEVVVLEKPGSDGPLSKHITLVEGKIHSDGGLAGCGGARRGSSRLLKTD